MTREWRDGGGSSGVQVKSDDLQAAGGWVQLECDGAEAENVCSGDGGFFCGAADSD